MEHTPLGQLRRGTLIVFLNWERVYRKCLARVIVSQQLNLLVVGVVGLFPLLPLGA
jgi:hypothetical protein